jgi:tetratricopeptide (TPR) repeat protein
MFLFRRQELAEAKAVHTRALAIREASRDLPGICQSLNALGLIGFRIRELAEGSAYFTAAVERAQQAGDAYWEGLGRTNLAEAHLEAGDSQSALAAVRPLPTFFAERGDPADEGHTLYLLAWAERLAGNLTAALAAINQALTIAEEASNRTWEAWWLIEAAWIHLAAGELAQAMDCCRMAASLERQIGDHSREATALDCTGEVLLASGNAQEAADFHREAARMHRELGDAWQEGLATLHLADCERALGRADASREQLAAALALLQAFSDVRALQLQAVIQERLR